MSTESVCPVTDLVDHPGAQEIATEAAARPAHPYSSFEQGGVRRFDRRPAQLPRFRVS
jgi:hypothetical protein